MEASSVPSSGLAFAQVCLHLRVETRPVHVLLQTRLGWRSVDGLRHIIQKFTAQT